MNGSQPLLVLTWSAFAHTLPLYNHNSKSHLLTLKNLQIHLHLNSILSFFAIILNKLKLKFMTPVNANLCGHHPLSPSSVLPQEAINLRGDE
jgi:hypothetical protein